MAKQINCKFSFEIYWKSFYLLPSISLMRDNMMYAVPNFGIRFDWLMVHTRLLFMRQRQDVSRADT